MASSGAGDCTPGTCPVEEGFLSEPPSLAGAAIMLVTFSVLVPINLWVGARRRTTTYTLILVAGLLVEVMGYAGRLLLRSDLASKTYFVLFLLGTVAGPTLITAAIFTTFPHILAVYGGDVSIVPKPVWLNYFFLFFNAFTLFFQVLGGAFVAEGYSRLQARQGLNVLIAGLALQVASIVIFLGAYFCFMRRVSRNREFLDPRFSDVYTSPKFKTSLSCIQVALAFILVRTIARLVQVATGLDSAPSQSQAYIVVLDGALVLLAAAALTAVPPSAPFGRAWGATSPSRRRARRHLAGLHLAGRASPRSPRYRPHEHESPYPSPQGYQGGGGGHGNGSGYGPGPYGPYGPYGHYGHAGAGASARGGRGRYSPGWGGGHKRQASAASSGGGAGEQPQQQQQQHQQHQQPAYERVANNYMQVPYVPAPQAAVSLSQQYGQGRVVESQVVAPGAEGARSGGSGPGSGGRTRTRSSPRVYEEDMVSHDALW